MARASRRASRWHWKPCWSPRISFSAAKRSPSRTIPPWSTRSTNSRSPRVFRIFCGAACRTTNCSVWPNGRPCEKISNNRFHGCCKTPSPGRWWITSPVKRGKWVLENILGTPPPPPPPDVPELKEGQAALTGTLRQRMEQHRENPMCASCHGRMDPIGFGLENFNAIGQWREKEGEFPIDPAGQLVTGENFNGPDDLKTILIKRRRQDFVHCLTQKMLTYGLGRGLEYYDKCAVDQIAKRLAKGHYRFSTLILEIVKSTPFQMRRGEDQQLTEAAK